jgi:CDP-4-dehydro-6-deoxyglucose reductase
MQLTLMPERVTIRVAEDRSLLDSALGAGVPLLHSCRGGSCGACRARLVHGDVHYPHGEGLGLSVEERAAGNILLCRARPRTDVAVEVRTLRSAAEVDIRQLPCRVEAVAHLSPGVLGLTLRLPAIEPFHWEPGQYVDLIMPDGQRRAYSVATRPSGAPRIELHIARVENGHVSGALFEGAAPGQLLAIEGPFGGLDLPTPEGPPLLLVAGGTGYAPVRAILQSLEASGRWQRQTRIYMGASAGADLYADAELRALVARHAHVRYIPVCSDGGGPADARAGRLPHVVLAEESALADVEVIAAGPAAMIAALRSTLIERGLPSTQFYADDFG